MTTPAGPFGARNAVHGHPAPLRRGVHRVEHRGEL